MKTQMKAGNLVAAYVDDPMGRRLVLAQSDPSPVTGKVYSAVDPIQIGTTQTELCCALDKVGDEPQRRIFWHAPRHGVTTALVAAMQLRPELTFAYANSRTGHTDSILRKIARPGVFPADRPLPGIGITGAILLDGYNPEPEQWEHLLTRVHPKASIFVLDYYGNHSPLFNMDRTIAAARALGFDEWNLT